jgi:hypothetical protein
LQHPSKVDSKREIIEAKFGPPNYREGKIKLKVAKFRDKSK